ncbi:hypothetical protein ABVK25_004192 [Lepraria finkii]|uniref:Uncharacterized protein n=1 Tax=Lepraria finkii TaxID=1340010 RepID=A0ABR4BEZ5_9LECA
MASGASSAVQQRRNSYNEMMDDTLFRPDDIYITTMGMTGSGESSLIATCCREATEEIGHELESKHQSAYLDF